MPTAKSHVGELGALEIEGNSGDGYRRRARLGRSGRSNLLGGRRKTQFGQCGKNLVLIGAVGEVPTDVAVGHLTPG